MVQIHILYVAHVQIYGSCIFRGISHSLSCNRTRDHIARSQLKQTMVPLHESLAAIVEQVSALAAKSLRNQESRRTGKRKCGRMKLVKLHVRQFSARLGSQCNAVAGGHGGVGCVAVNLPRSS